MKGYTPRSIPGIISQNGQRLEVMCSFSGLRESRDRDRIDAWLGRFTCQGSSHAIRDGQATLRLETGKDSPITVIHVDPRSPCTGFFRGRGPMPVRLPRAVAAL